MGTVKENYAQSRLDELLGMDGITTGIANSFLKWRNRIGSSTTRFGNDKWRSYGILKNEADIQNTIETYMEKTGISTVNLGAEPTSNAVKLSVTLKNLTREGVAFAQRNSNYSLSGTAHPGTRQYVATWTGAFVASQTITMTFTTTNIETGETSSATTLSVAWTTDDAGTKAAILSAIKANTGIHQTNTAWASHVLTIKTKAGYYMTVSANMASTGGSSPPTVTNVATDTSSISGTIDETNGTITNTSFGMADVSDFAAKQEIMVLTGTDDFIETAFIDYVDTDNNVIYLTTPLMQLPDDGATVTVVAKYSNAGYARELPDPVELRIDFDDHSSNSIEMYWFGKAKLVSSTMPKRTAEGKEATLEFEIFPERVLDGSTYKWRYFLTEEIMSNAGTY